MIRFEHDFSVSLAGETGARFRFRKARVLRRVFGRFQRSLLKRARTRRSPGNSRRRGARNRARARSEHCRVRMACSDKNGNARIAPRRARNRQICAGGANGERFATAWHLLEAVRDGRLRTRKVPHEDDSNVEHANDCDWSRGLRGGDVSAFEPTGRDGGERGGRSSAESARVRCPAETRRARTRSRKVEAGSSGRPARGAHA